MKRIILLVSLVLAFAGSANAANIDPSFDGGNGGTGMPTCNQYTNLMLAYGTIGGRTGWWRCYYWYGYGFGTWVAA